MEKLFYNALNIFYNGDYFKLKDRRERHGSWEAAYESVKKESKISPEKAWSWLDKQGIKLIFPADPEFPELLKEIPHPPFGIYVLGALPSDAVCISIVGTRKCTPAGGEIAYKFAKDLVSARIVVVSGLAFGIDTAAHQGAVDGGGKTVAVLAGGLDYIYPRQNEKLAKKILETGGGIISEYAEGSPSYPSRFVERNRLVSGLSVGTVIAEAPKKSGAFWTAQFALEQNRSVFVVPGPAAGLNYIGSHNLIRSGAVLVTDVRQILEDLNLVGPEKISSQPRLALLDEKQKAILAVLENESGPLTIDKIQELTKIEISELNQSLTLLLLQNFVKENGSKYYL